MYHPPCHFFLDESGVSFFNPHLFALEFCMDFIFAIFAGQLFNDMQSFDPSTQTWQDHSGVAAGKPPSPRKWHGFVAVGSGVYVLGGVGAAGASCFPF